MRRLGDPAQPPARGSGAPDPPHRVIVNKAVAGLGELERLARELEEFFNRAPCGFHSLDRDGLVVRMNDTELGWLGWPREAVVGKKRITELLTPAAGGTWQDCLPRLLGEGQVADLDLALLRRDGTALPVVVSATAVLDEAGALRESRSIVVDATRQARTERHLHAAVEAAPMGMLLVDREGTILMANRQVELIFGYDRTELVGRPVEVLVATSFRGEHPRLREDFLADPVARPMGRGRDLFGIRKDGSEVPLEVGLSPVETPTGRVVLASLVDITERSKQQASRYYEALARSNRELEHFAYVVSHDLRQPLRIILNYAQLLAEEYRPQLGDEARRWLDYIAERAKWMQRMIDGLLAYSRVGRGDEPFQSVDLGSVVATAVANLEMAIAESGARIDLGGLLPTLPGDYRELVQLFQNLLQNAIQYRGEQPPQIRITAQPRGLEWQFAVGDNGIGFDPRQTDRIFRMFQRLHDREAGPGAGLGLAIAKRIVERHRGRIWAESEPGRGSTFFLTLPAT